MKLDFLDGSVVKNPPAKQGTNVQSLGQEDPLEEEMATQSGILAWRIPLTEEPSRLQSRGLKSPWREPRHYMKELRPPTWRKRPSE